MQSIAENQNPVNADDSRVRLITSGTYAKVYKRPPTFQTEIRTKMAGGGVRGIVRGRSAASRRRFQVSMGRIDLSTIPGVLLLTLTWAGDVPDHERQAKCLDNFLKWLRRRFGPVPICWAKERGSHRGRWHYHLVVFAKDYISVKAYQYAWNRIAGAAAGNVDVAFKQDGHVVRYLAKYMSKEVGIWQDDSAPEKKPASEGTGCEVREAGAAEAGPVDLGSSHISPQEGHTGRTWGWREYESLPLHPWKVVQISEKAAHFIRRQMAKLAKAAIRRHISTWRGWHAAWKAKKTGDYPAWLVSYYSKNREKNQWLTMEWMFLVKIGLLEDDLKRLATRGSWLTRGGFQNHGWSAFFESGEALVSRLGAYFMSDFGVQADVPAQ